MTNFESEPIPYQPNQYVEKIGMIGDTANLILDTYGQEGLGTEGRAVDVASWKDEALMTTYELSRFSGTQPDLPSGAADMIQLTITEMYPNGEISKTAHLFSPSVGGHSSRFFEMTEAQKRELADREKSAVTLPNGTKILPPKRDDFEPEQEIELLLLVIAKGLEILSDDNA